MRIAMCVLIGLAACGTEEPANSGIQPAGAHILAVFTGTVSDQGKLSIEMTPPDPAMLTHGAPGRSEHASFEPSVTLGDSGVPDQARGSCANDWMWAVQVTAQGTSYNCTLEVIFDSMTSTAATCGGGSTALYPSAPFFPFHPPSDTFGYDNILKMSPPFPDGTPRNKWWTFAGAQTAAFSFRGYVLAPDSGC